MKHLNVNIDDFILSELINHKKIQEVKAILSSKNISLEFDINRGSFYRGYYAKDNNETCKYIIHVNVKESLKEDILNFNRRGILGDVFNPEAKVFIPKNIEDIGVYSILYTILHEYKHYIQDINGKLDNIDKSLDDNNRYIGKETSILEEEAELFALKHIYDLMYDSYNCLII